MNFRAWSTRRWGATSTAFGTEMPPYFRRTVSSRGAAFSTAKDHDSNYIDELTKDESVAVIADRAYGSDERRRALRARGVIDGIMYKRKRGQEKLCDWQERWNRLVSKLRARVEHPLGMMKKQFGYRRVRYRGLKRNEADFFFTVTAANVKRSLYLSAG